MSFSRWHVLKMTQLPRLIFVIIFYKQDGDKCNFVLLNSASIPGEWSIIGFPTPGESEIITHSIDDPQNIYLSKFGRNQHEVKTISEDSTVWEYVAQRMNDTYISREDIKLKIDNYGDRELPFSEGLWD